MTHITSVQSGTSATDSSCTPTGALPGSRTARLGPLVVMSWHIEHDPKLDQGSDRWSFSAMFSFERGADRDESRLGPDVLRFEEKWRPPHHRRGVAHDVATCTSIIAAMIALRLHPTVRTQFVRTRRCTRTAS